MAHCLRWQWLDVGECSEHAAGPLGSVYTSKLIGSLQYYSSALTLSAPHFQERSLAKQCMHHCTFSV